MTKPARKSRKGTTTAVFGVLLLVLITLVSGLLFYTFVMDNVNFTRETLNNQIAGLLLKSFTINSTYIAAFLKNTGAQIIEVSSA